MKLACALICERITGDDPPTFHNIADTIRVNRGRAVRFSVAIVLRTETEADFETQDCKVNVTNENFGQVIADDLIPAVLIRRNNELSLHEGQIAMQVGFHHTLALEVLEIVPPEWGKYHVEIFLNGRCMDRIPFWIYYEGP